MRRKSHLVRMAWLTLAILFISAPAFSQSCALCYTQAAAAGHRMIQALRSGIIVLMIPPAFMSVGFSVLAYRRRNTFAPDEKGKDDDEDNRTEQRW